MDGFLFGAEEVKLYKECIRKKDPYYSAGFGRIHPSDELKAPLHGKGPLPQAYPLPHQKVRRSVNHDSTKLIDRPFVTRWKAQSRVRCCCTYSFKLRRELKIRVLSLSSDDNRKP